MVYVITFLVNLWDFYVVAFVQVSEVYNLHRQTAYLAQDYFDRFMLTQEDVDKDHLQLIGITALFIASKTEVSLHFLLFWCLYPSRIVFTKMFFSLGNLSS